MYRARKSGAALVNRCGVCYNTDDPARRGGTERKTGMTYRIVRQNGDSIAVPQLVFHQLPNADEASVRVALYVLATGSTDPRDIAHALHLKSPRVAESALLWWAGAGLLEVQGLQGGDGALGRHRPGGGVDGRLKEGLFTGKFHICFPFFVFSSE